MEEIFNDSCASEDLKNFEKKFNQELCKGKVSTATQFEYSCFLVRSKYPADIKKGIVLLEDLYANKSGTGKRDYIYYLAIGSARLEDYDAALKYVDGIIRVEPNNRQVLELQSAIKTKRERQALKGAAIAGGVILGLGALIGVGVALARK